MKTLSFLFFTFLLLNTIYSQGNLQFNQVKLVSAIETVPAGKVWKVTNFLPTPNGNYQAISQPGLAEYLINIIIYKKQYYVIIIMLKNFS